MEYVVMMEMMNMIEIIYSILEFVGGNSIDTLLFGHANGLELLFNDNYAINGRFDEFCNKSL